MIRRHVTALRLALMTADAASAIAVFVAVSVFRFGAEDWARQWAGAGADAWLLAIAYSVGWAVTLWINGLYRMRSRWSARTELVDIARAGLLLAVLTFAALFLFKLPNVSRIFLIMLFSARSSPSSGHAATTPATCWWSGAGPRQRRLPTASRGIASWACA